MTPRGRRSGRFDSGRTNHQPVPMLSPSRCRSFLATAVVAGLLTGCAGTGGNRAAPVPLLPRAPIFPLFPADGTAPAIDGLVLSRPHAQRVLIGEGPGHPPG